MWITVTILILIVGLVILVFKSDLMNAKEQNELYDKNGNHIYYDRKIIRHLNKHH